MTRKAKLILALCGPLTLVSAMASPAEACCGFFSCLFGCGGRPTTAYYGGYRGHRSYRPVYTSFYAGYSAPVYPSYGVSTGCSSCCGNGCGIPTSSYYGSSFGNGYGTYGYPSTGCCGNTCGIGCSSGNCQLGTTFGSPTPATGPPPNGYTDKRSQTGDSHPTMKEPTPGDPGRTNPPDINKPGTISEDESIGTTDERIKVKRAEDPPSTPVNPPPENSKPGDAPKTDGADGAGFKDEIKDGSTLKPPVIKVNVDDKIAWHSVPTRTRRMVKPTTNTALLVRAAAYPDYAWIPSADPAHVAKK